MDAMANMPGISINQEGKVLLRGSDKVVILIDGKQSALTGMAKPKRIGKYSLIKYREDRGH